MPFERSAPGPAIFVWLQNGRMGLLIRRRVKPAKSVAKQKQNEKNRKHFAMI